ncbi:SagB/ThcOx family dehydrogenase [Glutamicibacter sp. BW78]|uniref:SagB/ThcOx family dehydrogenase n=1 Tax=Glutamicibacter sp. BW78 TaxID=2024403 RepID=UPI00130466E0|nr:SagB/ThcOx family dehydrogenase [Glutamicibacter sp. BW78]
MHTALALPSVETRPGLAELLASRRSIKKYDANQALNLEDIARLLWAAAGTTTPQRRSCPSAKATNPISITLVAGKVNDLEPGCYRYDALGHRLAAGPFGDHRLAVAGGTLDAREWLAECQALLLLTADMSAARLRFPDQPSEHGERFVWMEAGHSAQNVYLSAAEQNLGTCLVAGLDDDAMANNCNPLIPSQHQVLGVLGVGRPTA